MTVTTVLRALSALLGTVAWAYWWTAAPTGPLPFLFALWSAALLLWGLAFFSKWRVPRPSGATVAALLIIAVMTIPRAVALTVAPYAISLDEIMDPYVGLQVLRTQPWQIMSGVSGFFDHPFLLTVLQAWPCLFLPPLFGARVASLLLAIASLFSTYALAQRLFGRTAAMVTVTMLACSFWHISYSRMGYQFMQPVLFVPLALHAAIAGVEERNRFLQFIGGVLLGMTLLVYTPARIAIPIFALWFGHQVVTRKLRWVDAATAALVIGLGAAILLSPLFQRSGTRLVLSRFTQSSTEGVGPLHRLSEVGWTSPEGRELVALQVRTAFAVYYRGGAVFAPHDWVRTPLLDPLSLGLALLGLGVAVISIGDGGNFLVVVWVVATFLTAQLMTDLPYGAHRATPILPALALCAGRGAAALVALIRRWWRPWLSVLGLALLFAVMLPLNLGYLSTYLDTHTRDIGASMARFISAGSPAPVYYVVGLDTHTNHEVFRFLGDGHAMRDILSPMDSLGIDIDPKRDAVFVLTDWTTPAATAIRRCYPGATLLHEPSGPREAPMLALSVSQPAVAAGSGCTAPIDGPGLRARYFSGANWDGELVLERVEDWPARFRQDPKRFSSIEWSGFLQVPVTGTYYFQLMGDIAAGIAMIGPSLQLKLGDITGAPLDAGRYPLTIRCRPEAPNGYCWLRWTPPGGDWRGIAPEFLRPR